jgi:hypothetical protein
MSKEPDDLPLSPLIVVAPTFYTSLEESRFLLGLEACRQSAANGIRLILVDGSPKKEIIWKELEEAGVYKGKTYVRVVPQTNQGKKGVALREAIQLASDEIIHESKVPGIIAFQELEKVDMFRHWHSIVRHMMATDRDSDIVVPHRKETSFRSHYPIEQFHCETFINLYLDSFGKQIGMVPIDWTIGPVAFRSKFAKHWLDYKGDLWDAQLVPLVQAHLAGAKVSSFEIDYYHPEAMKQEEEGIPKWNEKRLMQANFLKNTVGRVMQEHLSKRNGGEHPE